MDRRQLLRQIVASGGIGAGAFSLSNLMGCARGPGSDDNVNEVGSLAWAVSGRWRNRIDRARDPFQHPIETLNFFEISAKDTVIEVWPGGGYMTEILAPYLAHGNGKYIAALFDTGHSNTGAQITMNEAFHAHFDSDKSIYGTIDYAQFGPATHALAAPNSVDKVLFFMRVQDWMAAGIAELAFSLAFAALKPDGILGVEQHRSDIGNIQDPAATSGYVQEPFVKQLATEVGFKFIESSEINANSKDSKDYSFGVWTLPPTRLTAPRGQAPNPNFDGSIYESIGESDRMTLKFRKPS